MTDTTRDLTYAFGSCVAATVMLAGLSIWWPPAQWDLVNKVIDQLANLNLMLAGALINNIVKGRV